MAVAMPRHGEPAWRLEDGNNPALRLAGLDNPALTTQPGGLRALMGGPEGWLYFL